MRDEQKQTPQDVCGEANSTCQLSWIIGLSPGLDTNLSVSCTGHQISWSIFSYELFCVLIWKLFHFLPKFEFSLIYSLVSEAFLHVFS